MANNSYSLADDSLDSFDDEDVRPPNFPRPSSTISKIRLANRLSFGPHKKLDKKIQINSNLTQTSATDNDSVVKASSLWLENDDSIYYSADLFTHSQIFDNSNISLSKMLGI